MTNTPLVRTCTLVCAHHPQASAVCSKLTKYAHLSGVRTQPFNIPRVHLFPPLPSPRTSYKPLSVFRILHDYNAGFCVQEAVVRDNAGITKRYLTANLSLLSLNLIKQVVLKVNKSFTLELIKYLCFGYTYFPACIQITQLVTLNVFAKASNYLTWTSAFILFILLFSLTIIKFNCLLFELRNCLVSKVPNGLIVFLRNQCFNQI